MKNIEDEKSVINYLINHAEEEPISFHMPGHKGQKFFERIGFGNVFNQMADLDITEIEGADNLFQAEGIIKNVEDKYAKLYGARHSHILVNGSSCGLIAAMMAVCDENEAMIVARNCHKSIFNGLTLGHIEPIYSYPKEIEGKGISGPVEVEEIVKLMDENPKVKAVILPSPNYYGVCSDIEKISDAVHLRGKVLIVDQAHGAHLKFMDDLGHGKRLSAEMQGADLVINSVHKTLGSFTQSAVLNVMSDRVDKDALLNRLEILQSSSPSYLLMASLDVAASYLLRCGSEIMASWENDIEFFYNEAKQINGLQIFEDENLDRTKININMSRLGLNGSELEQELMKYHIYVELVTGDIVMCMTGVGNVREDYEKLIEALKDIGKGRGIIEVKDKELSSIYNRKFKMENIPTKWEKINIEDAEGKISRGSLIPYPPGIPIICSGEVIESEVIDYVVQLRKAGEKVIGIDEQGKIKVGRS